VQLDAIPWRAVVFPAVLALLLICVAIHAVADSLR
jgi:hypothetical protein